MISFSHDFKPHIPVHARPRQRWLSLISLGPMHAIFLAMSLLASSPSTSSPVVSPQLLVGKWRIENDGLYFFRADSTWECRAADIIDGGRWKLRDGHTLELITEHFRSKPTNEIIVIDRVVHETLYVRTKYQREVRLKQPGP